MTWKTLSSPIKGIQNNNNRENYGNSLFGPYICLLADFLESGKSNCWGFLWYTVSFMEVLSSQKFGFRQQDIILQGNTRSDIANSSWYPLECLLTYSMEQSPS